MNIKIISLTLDPFEFHQFVFALFNSIMQTSFAVCSFYGLATMNLNNGTWIFQESVFYFFFSNAFLFLALTLLFSVRTLFCIQDQSPDDYALSLCSFFTFSFSPFSIMLKQYFSLSLSLSQASNWLLSSPLTFHYKTTRLSKVHLLFSNVKTENEPFCTIKWSTM